MGGRHPGRGAVPALYPGLLAAYTVMAVMETVGFAAVFPHGRAIALAGALGMGIPAALRLGPARPRSPPHGRPRLGARYRPGPRPPRGRTGRGRHDD